MYWEQCWHKFFPRRLELAGLPTIQHARGRALYGIRRRQPEVLWGVLGRGSDPGPTSSRGGIGMLRRAIA